MGRTGHYPQTQRLGWANGAGEPAKTHRREAGGVPAGGQSLDLGLSTAPENLPQDMLRHGRHADLRHSAPHVVEYDPPAVG